MFRVPAWPGRWRRSGLGRTGGSVGAHFRAAGNGAPKRARKGQSLQQTGVVACHFGGNQAIKACGTLPGRQRGPGRLLPGMARERSRHNRAAFHFPSSPPCRSLCPSLACSAGLAGAGAENASEAAVAPVRLDDFGYSPYTLHYSDAKKENDWARRYQKHSLRVAVAGGKGAGQRHIAGLAIFSNLVPGSSRSTPTTAGSSSRSTACQVLRQDHRGIIHGYKSRTKKKIPLNHKAAGASRQFPPSATK